MSNQELADAIYNRFIPLAFKCECKFTDPDCAEARDDTYAWAQAETVERIVKYIKLLGE